MPLPQKTVGSVPRWTLRGLGMGAGSAGLCLAVTAVLLVVVVYPLALVVGGAFVREGLPTAAPLAAFFGRELFREALGNSLLAGCAAVLAGTALALPLAFATGRYRFAGQQLVRVLGVLPLVVPPYIGAVALQLVLGRSGAVNLLLRHWLGVTVPFMEGLPGVVLVQSLHYFPFILLNVTAALSRADRSLEEAAQGLGARRSAVLRRITLPLLLPGYVAGALLVFVKTVDDLGTPLMLNYTSMLAPQAYLRITNVGYQDPTGYVIAVIMVLLSCASLWTAMWYVGRAEYATGRAAPAATVTALVGWRRTAVWVVCALVLGVSLLPQLGIVLLSFAKVWSVSLLPQAYTLDHYREVLLRAPHFVGNTVVYCLAAALIDVAFGGLIAHLLVRSRLPGLAALDLLASLPLAVPGVVIGMAYLRAFHDWVVPGLEVRLTASGLILVLAYAVRRLPYTVRSTHAALQQVHVSYEEAAHGLGARPGTTFWRITRPLIAPGVMAGGVVAFVTSAVELSSTMLLVPTNGDGPISFGIYVYMQSALGRGPAAALGVIAIAVVAGGTWLANRAAGGTDAAFRV